MIYFDNAASGGRKPDAVLSAVQSAIKVCANAGRSGHKLALACAQTVQDARHALNAFFGGYGPDRVVFTKNCSEALNIALLGVLQQGDHVVVKFFKGVPFSVECDNFVVLQVTKADPAVKGNTATNTTKKATLETGITIDVPMFVEEGEYIRVDTRVGEYMERVKG